MINKLSIWYKNQSSTTKGFIWLGLILIIGIILRWEYVSGDVIRGFDFLKIKK